MAHCCCEVSQGCELCLASYFIQGPFTLSKYSLLEIKEFFFIFYFIFLMLFEMHPVAAMGES